jgi:hypothetical protein
MRAMDVKFWTKKLKGAERELDAATRLSRQPGGAEAHASQGGAMVNFGG